MSLFTKQSRKRTDDEVRESLKISLATTQHQNGPSVFNSPLPTIQVDEECVGNLVNVEPDDLWGNVLSGRDHAINRKTK